MTQPIGDGAGSTALLRALKGVEAMRATAAAKAPRPAAEEAVRAFKPDALRAAAAEPGRTFPRGSFVDLRV